LQIYLGLFFSKKVWKKFIKSSHNILHNLINQKITIYLVVVVITMMVLINSLQAKEIAPEDIGKKSIMYELVAEEEALDLIEDSTPAQVPSSEEAALYDLALTSEDELSQQEIPQENTLSLIAGGSSLLASGDSSTPHTRTEIETYTVQPGDTVTSIAKQFGISVNTVLWANNLSAYSIIRPGKTLKILPVSGIIYKIKKGDTLAGIAKKYQSNQEEIIKTNPGVEEKLTVGAEIIIPGGIPPAPKITKPKTKLTTRATDNTPAVDTGTKLLWPAKSHRINQYYNWRHRGLDINGRWGDPIYAAESGKVETSGWNTRGYGYYIIINHGNGIRTLYAHNSKNLVKVGDTVTRGQIIGYIGSTGRSTGPHIHFEVRTPNKRVNPLLYTK